MYDYLITEQILFRMIESGALVLKGESKDSPFLINFAIMEERYPQYLEYFIEQSLNVIEQSMWRNGFIHYTILDNGMLQWHVTPLGRRAAKRLNDTE